MRLLMLRLKRGDGTGQNVDSAAWKKRGESASNKMSIGGGGG